MGSVRLGWAGCGVGRSLRGRRGGGKERRKRASSAPLFSAKSWGYSALQYILRLPDLTPKTNRRASRFAMTASALRASAAEPGRRGVPKLRNFPEKFGRHTAASDELTRPATGHPPELLTLCVLCVCAARRGGGGGNGLGRATCLRLCVPVSAECLFLPTAVRHCHGAVAPVLVSAGRLALLDRLPGLRSALATTRFT
jgi:hypothetical protein